MKNLLLFLLSVTISAAIYAQAPQALNYQAIARNLDGSIISGQSIRVRFSILDGSATGTVVYQEAHQTTPNNFGVFTLAIGSGNVVSGNFSGINWSTGFKFLKVEIAPQGGTNFSLQGTTQLLSVPYALYAEKSGTASQQGLAGANGKTILNGAINPTAATGADGDFYINTATNQIFGPKTPGGWGTAVNLTGPVGPAGPAGPQGSTGAAGAIGPAGATGAIGPVGPQGIAGVPGAMGATGQQGPIGPAGPAGAIGPAGATGTTGPVGPQGIAGVAGATGATGQQGPVGPTGPAGATGANGLSILNGAIDPTAATGVDGDFYINTATNQIYGPKASGSWGTAVSLTGPVGPAGPAGPAGATGQQGPAGATGATGPVGPQGSTGAAGPTGQQGPTGLTGPAGASGKTILNGTIDPATTTGVDEDFYINTATNQIFGPKAGGLWGAGISLTGPAGPAGPQGNTGVAGATGQQGPAGATGPQGIAGVAGATGQQGPAGVNGKTILSGTIDPATTTGADGDFYINTATNQIFGPKTPGGWGTAVNLTGPAGATGPAGPQGIAGVAGATGQQGPIGLTGPAGAIGPAGATGAAGPVGPQGIAGVAGAMGATGQQGQIGPIGPAGPQGSTGVAGATGQQGPVGANGKTILNGTIDPTAATGADGDFYINTATNQIFGPRTPGGWGTAVGLTGPAGVKSLIDLQNFSANAACPSGGITIRSGVDNNNNNVLDPSEIDNTKDICFAQKAAMDKLIILPLFNSSVSTATTSPTIAGYLLKFNKNNYPLVDSIIFIADPYVSYSSNAAIVTLYNRTDNTPVANSTLISNNVAVSQFMETGNLYNSLPNYDITLGISLQSANSGTYAASCWSGCYLYLYRK